MPGRQGKSKYSLREARVLRVAVTTALITTFAGSSLNVAIPSLSAEYHMSGAAAGWIITMYTLVTSMLSVPTGRLSVKIGNRKGLITGIGIFGAMCIAAVFSVNGTMVITCRALQGIGASFIFATNMAIVVSVFPPEKSGAALGIMTAGTYTGLSVGPVLGGILNSYFGWRSIFIVMFIISAVAFIEAVRHLEWKQEARDSSLHQDIRGTLLYMAGLAMIMTGFSELTAWPYGKYLLAAGIAVMAVFFYIETRTDDPVVEVRIFLTNRIFTLSNITALLNYGAIFSISYLVSIYLQVVKGFGSQAAGLILVIQPVIQAVLSPGAGRLSDRVEAWKLVTAGMVICSAALFCFSMLSENSPLWLVVALLAAAGTGVSLFSSPNTNQILSSVGPQDKTFASATLSTMRTIGQTGGMAAVTLITSLFLGTMTLQEAPASMLIKTMHTAFIVSTALCIAGAVMSTARSAGSVSGE
ncbi:MAG: MFS transporter [Anaerovoracaceae bacterium]|nr:MFS transporter [Anaerovoracaceae bacterium]